jgi:hypothetical protein
MNIFNEEEGLIPWNGGRRYLLVVSRSLPRLLKTLQEGAFDS